MTGFQGERQRRQIKGQRLQAGGVADGRELCFAECTSAELRDAMVIILLCSTRTRPVLPIDGVGVLTNPTWMEAHPQQASPPKVKVMYLFAGKRQQSDGAKFWQPSKTEIGICLFLPLATPYPGRGFNSKIGGDRGC